MRHRRTFRLHAPRAACFRRRCSAVRSTPRREVAPVALRHRTLKRVRTWRSEGRACGEQAVCAGRGCWRIPAWFPAQSPPAVSWSAPTLRESMQRAGLRATRSAHTSRRPDPMSLREGSRSDLPCTQVVSDSAECVAWAMRRRAISISLASRSTAVAESRPGKTCMAAHNAVPGPLPRSSTEPISSAATLARPGERGNRGGKGRGQAHGRGRQRAARRWRAPLAPRCSPRRPRDSTRSAAPRPRAVCSVTGC